ncbi:MAG TPA: IS21 family transposase [Burkholderiales bacterium]|jgi:transposase|nr:IS21 family transposase [Burkholderiales bacterium]
MIDAAVVARIRRLFFAEHWKVGTIAAELGVHHDAVRRAIDIDRFATGARRVPASRLDPYKGFIAETLEKHPRLRATRLHEMLRARGYPGSAVQLRRYVATVRPVARAEAYLRLRTFPGEQGQVDWGHFGKLRVGSALRPLSCFVLVLSWSRAVFARFFLDQTLESFLRGHVLAFEALGGVPRTLLYDNLKTAVLERQGEHIRFHPHLLELAGHYHFAPQPCAPYRGNEKGKVERTIQYLRHSFFEARRFSAVDDLNAQLADWIARVAHARPVPGDPDRRLVRAALDEERTRLLPLPQNPFACDRVAAVSSGKTPYVRFDLNDYSIPHDRVGLPLTLTASESTVRIADATGAVVATHGRSWGRRDIVEDPAHLARLAAEKRRARDLRGRDRLRSVCKQADAFLDALARRGDALATATARLGRLLDHYGAAELDAALADALARGALSADSVAHVLDQRARARRAAPPLDVPLPDDPRIRDLRVTPHPLDGYDRLAARTEDDHEPR